MNPSLPFLSFPFLPIAFLPCPALPTLGIRKTQVRKGVWAVRWQHEEPGRFHPGQWCWRLAVVSGQRIPVCFHLPRSGQLGRGCRHQSHERIAVP